MQCHLITFNVYPTSHFHQSRVNPPVAKVPNKSICSKHIFLSGYGKFSYFVLQIYTQKISTFRQNTV